MNPSLLRRTAVLLRIGLAVIFIYAGVAKLAEARTFTASIAMLQIVPFRWAEWIAAILPLAELFTGLWLLVGWRTRAAALAAMLLGAVFVVAIGQAIARSLDVNCHCFGVTTDATPAWFVISRALVLFSCSTLLRQLAIKAPRDAPLV